MYKNNIAIQYHDFHPSENTRFFIESIVNEMYGELPGGATVKATFTNQGDVMKGMLQIGSYNGPFFAVATASSLREVTMKLTEQMRRRLEKWKARNHERRSLRHLQTSPQMTEAS